MWAEQDFPKFDPDIYTRIAMNNLVTYAVYFLSQLSKEISDGDIVAACFYMFPKRFELRGYTQWPDASVVAKRWIDCRNKGLIVGSTAQGLSLTPKGLSLAEKVGKTLSAERPIAARQGIKIRTETRTRSGRFVKALEESEAYQLFQRSGEQSDISEFDFRSMLLCTMDSSANVMRNNLEQFKQHISHYDREDLLSFLNYCESKFSELLTDGAEQAGKYRGGMLRRKVK